MDTQGRIGLPHLHAACKGTTNGGDWIHFSPHEDGLRDRHGITPPITHSHDVCDTKVVKVTGVRLSVVSYRPSRGNERFTSVRVDHVEEMWEHQTQSFPDSHLMPVVRNIRQTSGNHILMTHCCHKCVSTLLGVYKFQLMSLPACHLGSYCHDVLPVSRVWPPLLFRVHPEWNDMSLLCRGYKSVTSCKPQ